MFQRLQRHLILKNDILLFIVITAYEMKAKHLMQKRKDLLTFSDHL